MRVGKCARSLSHRFTPCGIREDPRCFIRQRIGILHLHDAAGGYPQLSAEYVVGQQPDLIVLADTVCCGQSVETIAQRPAFDTVPAVVEGRVLAADDDIASRWGPRVADFAESVAGALQG